MKPIFKYSGGKSREAKFISTLAPIKFSRVVEPFAGSAAMSFFFEKPALIGDVRQDAMTCLRVAQDPKLYKQLQKRVDELKLVSSKFELEPMFYHWRDKMWQAVDPLDRAFRWIVIRQLVFSGIDRSNAKTGKENAPFGWYDQFKCNLSDKHHNLISTWEIKTQSAVDTLEQVKDGDFVFLDPPYLSRNSSYGSTAPEEKMHDELLSKLDKIKQPWLIVHCEHPVYLEFAKRHVLVEKDFMYSQNFKGRDNTKSKTRHLYIKNF